LPLDGIYPKRSGFISLRGSAPASNHWSLAHPLGCNFVELCRIMQYMRPLLGPHKVLRKHSSRFPVLRRRGIRVLPSQMRLPFCSFTSSRKHILNRETNHKHSLLYQYPIAISPRKCLFAASHAISRHLDTQDCTTHDHLGLRVSFSVPAQSAAAPVSATPATVQTRKNTSSSAAFLPSNCTAIWKPWRGRSLNLKLSRFWTKGCMSASGTRAQVQRLVAAGR
jgi:hypothetical protein